MRMWDEFSIERASAAPETTGSLKVEDDEKGFGAAVYHFVRESSGRRGRTLTWAGLEVWCLCLYETCVDILRSIESILIENVMLRSCSD